MIKEIRRIAELQPLYSSQNTPEMKERGRLIRTDLPNSIRTHWGVFQNCLGRFSDDMDVEGSDGIGRKTQAPWVRIFSESLSPSATTGFYVVIHFSVDGQSCFVTVGFGANKWDSEKGDLVKYSEGELNTKLNWANQIYSQSSTDTSSFHDTIDIGSKHALPKTFERATVLCKRHSIHTVTENDLVNSISSALKLLALLYENFSQFNDLAESEIAELQIESIVNPANSTLNTRQGYGLSARERKAVELRAMDVVHDYLNDLGYRLKDTSLNKPYDFIARKDDEEIKVEVKGTTSDVVDSIMMTANEVTLHTKEAGYTALAIVSSINFVERGKNPLCDGGKLEFLFPWDIREWLCIPKAFLVTRTQ